MRSWIALPLLVALLAGCTDTPTEVPLEDGGFDDVPVVVDDQTGGIRGVVINDAIIPVEGAAVKLLSTEFSATTDSQGRFTFSKVPPGTYFLSAEKALHQSIQSSVEVKAGLKEPPIVKLQMPRLFQADPYLQVFAMDGFFTCTQAGLYVGGYGSSPCHSYSATLDFCALAGACLDQERVFETTIGPGWQTLVYEMTWDSSAYGTSQNIGVVMSEDYETRSKSHNWANYGGPNPVMFAINVGEEGPNAQSGAIPEEGVPVFSMFQGVRSSGLTPGLAIDQSFQAWLTSFYYAPAPEGWSFMRGDPAPF